MAIFTSIEVRDIRFPTSTELDGSDAMNPEPDYSAAYLIIRTSDSSAPAGHGFVFTTGRGNDVQCAAIAALSPWLVGRNVDETLANLGGLARELSSDPQLRWLGPEKGVSHMAVGAIINALWDLRAKLAGVPLWELLAGLSVAEILDLVDFRYLEDALTRNEAAAILQAQLPYREQRIQEMHKTGLPAYATSPGWMGYSDEKVLGLARAAVAEGFDLIKIKVGENLEYNQHRLGLLRADLGDAVKIAIDANQVWNPLRAISAVTALQELQPYWVEEPTNPDDIIAHRRIREAIKPIPVAAGEHVHNRVMFKQLMQAEAIDVVQIDACRVGGVNENLAVLLLAAKFGLPVCPHAGGVGLCELVQHLAMFDFIAISGTTEHRYIEYVDHLHEHFVNPVKVIKGRYFPPSQPGFSAEIKHDSQIDFTYPTGIAWQAQRGKVL